MAKIKGWKKTSSDAWKKEDTGDMIRVLSEDSEYFVGVFDSDDELMKIPYSTTNKADARRYAVTIMRGWNS